MRRVFGLGLHGESTLQPRDGVRRADASPNVTGPRLPPIEILNRDGCQAVRGHQTEDSAVKVQLSLQAADDRVVLAEAVLLALEGQEGDRYPPRPHGVGHHLRLIRGYHLVLEALEENERTRQPVDRVDRGPGAINVAPGGVGSDQLLEVPGLELVCLTGHGFEIADTVV